MHQIVFSCAPVEMVASSVDWRLQIQAWAAAIFHREKDQSIVTRAHELG